MGFDTYALDSSTLDPNCGLVTGWFEVNATRGVPNSGFIIIIIISISIFV